MNAVFNQLFGFHRLGEINGERHPGQVGKGFGHRLQHDHDGARLKRFCQVPRMESQPQVVPSISAASRGDPHIRGSLVTGDNLDRQIERGFDDLDDVVRAEGARPRSTNFSGDFAANHFSMLLTPLALVSAIARLIARHGADKDKLLRIEFDSRLPHQLTVGEPAAEMAEGETVEAWRL